MSVLNRLTKFARKSYRDGYLQSQVRGGIAYQIQALREKFRLTQEAFAERTGKKQSVISRLENTEYGRVSVQTLLDIATSLDVALLVKFVSYPEFLRLTDNQSTAALQPHTIFESIEHREETMALRDPYSNWPAILMPTEQVERKTRGFFDRPPPSGLAIEPPKSQTVAPKNAVMH